ncbi:MAG: aminotransferase [Pseudomonadota bacterium]
MTLRPNPVFSARPKSIFPTMSALARECDAINLGQGFPDEDGPREIRDIAARAFAEGPNQYAPIEGIKDLRDAIAEANKRFYGLDVDPETETLVVGGATVGLAATFLGLLSPGDEAVVLAPFYECYAPQIEATGATMKVVALEPPRWTLTAEALDAALTDKTKLIVINTPHNPVGKVMDRAELEIVAEACRRRDLVAVCDEVYEHITFDNRRHTPLMTLPGMRERAVRIGSAGKTFSVTGFRIGYLTGAAPLITAILKAHQHLTYTCPAPLQTAVAAGLRLGDDYYAGLAGDMQAKRDLLHEGLVAAGFDVLPCEGAYFITVDIGSVGRDDDRAFCEEITKNARVAAVPLSAFYQAGAADGPRRFVRFCFCKKPAILREASDRLAAYLK